MQQQQGNNPGDTTLFAPEHKSMRAIFVHGLFLRGYEAVWLRRYLRREGIRLERFRYASRKESPTKVVARLAEALRRAPDIHVIAHSLGGLITLTALAEVQPDWQGRAVLLGSPLAGSECARRVVARRGGSWLLGAARDILCNGLTPLPLPLDRVAVIAGTCNQGVGRVLRACSPPGDGVVRLAETRIDGAVYLSQVNTTHLGLIFNRHVADTAVRFILTGV